jgi:hypothetical protein
VFFFRGFFWTFDLILDHLRIFFFLVARELPFLYSNFYQIPHFSINLQTHILVDEEMDKPTYTCTFKLTQRERLSSGPNGTEGSKTAEYQIVTSSKKVMSDAL